MSPGFVLELFKKKERKKEGALFLDEGIIGEKKRFRVPISHLQFLAFVGPRISTYLRTLLLQRWRLEAAIQIKKRKAPLWQKLDSCIRVLSACLGQ